MAGRVDARALVVRDGAAGIPFAVDCGTGTATLDPGGEPHKLRVLRWSEKCSLARFADAGAAFIEQQFVAICGGGVHLEDPPRRAAATALAVWLHGSIALPLDPALLSEVTIRLCGTLGVGPAELAALPAPEVEALWNADRAEETEAGAGDAPGPPAADRVTRILIEPDPPAGAEPPPQAEAPPDHHRATPISAEVGPRDRGGAGAEPEAASALSGSMPAPDPPRPAEAAGSPGRAEAACPPPGSIAAFAAPGRAEAASAPPGSIAASGAPGRAEAASAPPGSITTSAAPGRAEAASARPQSIPAPAARRPADPAGSRERERAAPHPCGTRAGATATGAGEGTEAAAETTEAVFRSGMPPGATADDVRRPFSSKAGPIDGPASQGNRPSDRPLISRRPPTAALAPDSDRSAATPAIPSAPDRSRDAGAASGASRPPPGSPAQPVERFRLVSAEEMVSDIPGPCPGDGRPPAVRPSSKAAGRRAPTAPESAATAASVRASSNRRLQGTPRPGRGRPADLAAALEAAGPAGPDDVPAYPADPGIRPFAGTTIPTSIPVPPQALEGPEAGHEPAGGARRRAASSPKSPMPSFNLPSFPAPETEAATAIDSRLRALIDIVSRAPETPSDLDGNPEAMIDAFSERLAEAASELGLTGSV